MNSNALNPSLWSMPAHREITRLRGAAYLATCVVFISLMAQVAIPLSFTPVPITGQTFAVAVVALSMGRRLGLVTVMTYLTLGVLGLPIFATAVTLASSGYLVGMALASALMGELADRGWTKSFKRAWLASAAGSVAVYLCGLIGLSFFVPLDGLLMAGFLPFIPGDLIKMTLAASIVSSTQRARPRA